MALIWAEGFDHYTRGNASSGSGSKFGEEYGGKWTAFYPGGMSIVPSDLGGGCLMQYQSAILELSVGKLTKAVQPDANGRLFLGFRLRTDGLAVMSVARLWTPSLIADRMIGEVLVSAEGQLIYREITYAADGAETRRNVIVSKYDAIAAGSWTYIELGIDQTAGTIEVRLNGASLGAPVPCTFQQGIGRFMLRTGAFMIRVLWDDVYVADSTGTVNNSFLGDVRILSLPPAADVERGFTPNVAGSANFDSVNDAPGPDEDATFNTASAMGARDLFSTQGTMLRGSYNVKGVQTVIRARKKDSGTRYLAAAVRSGITDAVGKGKPISTDHQYQTDVFERDPATGAPWTIAGTDAAAFGYTIKSGE